MQDKDFKDDVEIMADFFQKLNDKAGQVTPLESRVQGSTSEPFN